MMPRFGRSHCALIRKPGPGFLSADAGRPTAVAKASSPHWRVLESLQVSLLAADCATRTGVAGERSALRHVSFHQGGPLCRGLVTGTSLTPTGRVRLAA